MTYEQTLQYLFHLQKTGMKMGLSSMFDLLADLDHPHRRLKTIHVGGTNGKGSACATLAACLQSSGYKVGLYTSPHLIDFNERIRVNSIPIAQKQVIRLTHSIMNSMGHTPTFFEFTTAMAFLYFLEEEVDIAVIEVGLGGRLDSTNVITPLVSVITNIDFDHQATLGNTLLEIGREKAGIIKNGVPVVSGVAQAEVRSLMTETAAALGAPYYQLGSHFSFESLDVSPFQNLFHYNGLFRSYRNLSTPLLGDHQKANTTLALAAFELIQVKRLALPVRNAGFGGIGECSEGPSHGPPSFNKAKMFSFEEEQMRAGLQKISWPGRMEKVQEKPLIILDGAHNPAGAGTLSDFLRKLDFPGKKILVLGIMKDKNIYEMGEALFPWADEIILTQPRFERAALPQELLETLPPTSKPVHLIKSIGETLRFVRTKSGPGDIICFTGSLYTIGEVKAVLEGIEITVPLHG